MNKIAVLSPQEAQKIAAGEVVERPANIIKELVENALDAQATAVSVYIDGAGKELIRVVDNGAGMSREDALLCFYPHATSKITSLEDLVAAQTFGFRGEALASIAAVSKVTLKTSLNKRIYDVAADRLGTTVIYEGGLLIGVEEAAHPAGADFAIADLFYNVPARKKFLKQDETEWNQIFTTLQAFCLSNNTVHFKIYRDGKLVLNAPAVTTLLDRITQVWDYSLAQGMCSLAPLEESKKTAWLSVAGAISASHVWRYGKQHVFVFVNGRFVKDSELNKALFKGYLNVLPPGKFPAAVLFVTVDPALVDVNVHPKKEEVRFTKPLTVQQVIKDAIQKTLAHDVVDAVQLEQQAGAATQSYDGHAAREIPQYGFQAPKNKPQAPSYLDFLGTAVLQSVAPEALFSKHVAPQAEASHQEIPPADYDDGLLNSYPFDEAFIETSEEPAPFISNVQEELVVSQAPQGRFVGQLFKTYLLIEHEDALVVVDQHAAHERILYEKFTERFERAAGSYLMFPQIIQLEESLMRGLLTQEELFAFHGIEFDNFGSGKLAIKTCPPGLLQADLEDFIRSCAQIIAEYESVQSDEFRKKVHEHIHGQMACKSAIKAGDVLTAQQATQLFADLQKTAAPFICVHGRPTMWRVSQYELEKQFRRR